MLKLPAVLTHAIASKLSSTLDAEVLAAPTAVVVDAGALQQFDSSALAVLLECRRQALAAGKTFSVLAAPERLLQLASVYGVAELISSASPVLAVS